MSYKEEEIKIKTVDDLNKKPTAVAHIGGWNIMFSNITFTKKQIKNYKKYFGIEIENLENK